MAVAYLPTTFAVYAVAYGYAYFKYRKSPREKKEDDGERNIEIPAAEN